MQMAEPSQEDFKKLANLSLCRLILLDNLGPKQLVSKAGSDPTLDEVKLPKKLSLKIYPKLFLRGSTKTGDFTG